MSSRSPGRIRVFASFVGVIGLYNLVATGLAGMLWTEELEDGSGILVVAVSIAALCTSWLAWHLDRRARWVVLVWTFLTVLSVGVLLPIEVQSYAWPGYAFVTGVGVFGFWLLSGDAVQKGKGSEG
jgi:hypothetical protein